jgi:hypothetical protein
MISSDFQDCSGRMGFLPVFDALKVLMKLFHWLKRVMGI